MGKKEAFEKYRQFLSGFECAPEESDYAAFEHTKNLLSLMANVENSSLCVFDMSSKHYSFMRTKFDQSVKYPESEHYKSQPGYFFQFMPEEDVEFSVDTMIQGLGFVREKEWAEKKAYKLIFEYRLSDPAGNLFRFLQQCVVLELDKHGNIWQVLILNDIIPNSPGNHRLNRKLIHIPSGKICLFHDDQEPSSKSAYLLTKRELEVLGLINQGLLSKEIADQLFISVNTVNNHRQKIIEKMHAENTKEALQYAQRIGII